MRSRRSVFQPGSVPNALAAREAEAILAVDNYGRTICLRSGRASMAHERCKIPVRELDRPAAISPLTDSEDTDQIALQLAKPATGSLCWPEIRKTSNITPLSNGLIYRIRESSTRGYSSRSGSPTMAANSNTFRLRSSTFSPKSRSCRSAINKMAFSTWSEW